VLDLDGREVHSAIRGDVRKVGLLRVRAARFNGRKRVHNADEPMSSISSPSASPSTWGDPASLYEEAADSEAELRLGAGFEGWSQPCGCTDMPKRISYRRRRS
jgi:hypothetical protein